MLRLASIYIRTRTRTHSHARHSRLTRHRAKDLSGLRHRCARFAVACVRLIKVMAIITPTDAIYSHFACLLLSALHFHTLRCCWIQSLAYDNWWLTACDMRALHKAREILCGCASIRGTHRSQPSHSFNLFIVLRCTHKPWGLEAVWRLSSIYFVWFSRYANICSNVIGPCRQISFERQYGCWSPLFDACVGASLLNGSCWLETHI